MMLFCCSPSFEDWIIETAETIALEDDEHENVQEPEHSDAAIVSQWDAYLGEEHERI
jgi:non-ribosomal peptide synthetase component E (peptide arylation enzyme)